MLTVSEISRLKTVYIVVMIFTSFRGFGVLVPNGYSAVNTTYSKWMGNCQGTKIVVGKEIKELNIPHKWMDTLLLLEVLLWEMFPLYHVGRRKLPVDLRCLGIWTTVHFIMSTMYILNKMTGISHFWGITCRLEIALQVISVSLIQTIFWWGRALQRERRSLMAFLSSIEEPLQETSFP